MKSEFIIQLDGVGSSYPAAKKRRIEVSKIPETNNNIDIAGKKVSYGKTTVIDDIIITNEEIKLVVTQSTPPKIFPDKGHDFRKNRITGFEKRYGPLDTFDVGKS
jgi:hypothetical protein